MNFPETFIYTLIMIALISIGVASVVLVILLIRDLISKKLW